MGGRRFLAPVAAVLGGVIAVAIGWRCLVQPNAETDQPPTPASSVHEGSVTSLYSPRTPQLIAAMMGAHVRLVWLRARDWREVRRSREHTQIDADRFTVTLATPSREPDLLEPAARIDGGSKDADVPGIGRWIDRRGAFAIMAMDTEYGQERELVPTARLYNPLIMPDGQHVIFSSDDPATGTWSISMIAWDGTDRRVLGQGYALWVWSDPTSGRQWIYACNQMEAGKGVWRMEPGQPQTRMPVYGGEISLWFSLSHDGRRASGCFPWPVVGMVDLPSGILDTRGFRGGCNAYIAPDDSYLISVLNGAHNGVTIYDPGQPGIEASLIPPLMKRTKIGGPGKMWNPKWAGDSHHVLVCGPIRPTTVDAAELWLGVYASDYRSIKQWIQVTHSDSYDVCAHLWCDPGLGDRRGPAPLTISLDGLKPGAWAIDFGDGGQGGAMATFHTYVRPGVYAISARRGDEIRRGRVTVEGHKSPVSTAAYRRGAHEVEIRFDHVIASADLCVLSPSKVPATQLAVSGDGLRAFCSFAEAIHPPGSLTLSGVHAPLDAVDEHGATEVAVSAEPWPSDPSDLAFAWANALRDNSWYCAGRFAIASLVRHGAARVDRDGSLLLAGGSYVARLDEGVSPWPEQLHVDHSSALSFELTIRLRDGATARADLISIGPPPPGGTPLTVERSGPEIRFVFGGKQIVIGHITDHTRHHLAVSCHDASAYAFLDGAPAGVLTDLGTVLPARDRLELAGGGWQGSIEGIAVYRRALTQGEIAGSRTAYAGIVAGTKEVISTRVHAVLSARSLIPGLDEIRPYRDALVVCEYDSNPENSNLAKQIYVAQWGIIDGVRTPLAELAIGSACDLELEDIADHPELESAWLTDTLAHLPSASIFVESGR